MWPEFGPVRLERYTPRPSFGTHQPNALLLSDFAQTCSNGLVLEGLYGNWHERAVFEFLLGAKVVMAQIRATKVSV